MVRIDKVSITNALRSKIINQIRSDLTEGRKCYKKEAYSSEMVMEFIETNKDFIEELIRKLIQVYEERDELYVLIRPKKEHIMEFFYDFFNIPLNDEELFDAI
jgi:hypothetical protein